MLCAYCRNRMLDSCSGLTLSEALAITRYAKRLNGDKLPDDLLVIFDKAEAARVTWLAINVGDRHAVTDVERKALIRAETTAMIEKAFPQGASTLL